MEAERSLLNEIGAYIAAKVSEMSVSKVALEIGTMQKSELLRDSNGYPILRLKLDFQRAYFLFLFALIWYVSSYVL